MKKCLMVLLALAITTTMSSGVKARSGSAQQCRSTLDTVLRQLNIKKPFWTLSGQEILEFKKQAQEKGLWAQFAQVCNAWTTKQCKGCQCGRDFRNTACSPNCGCCWGNQRCPS